MPAPKKIGGEEILSVPVLRLLSLRRIGLLIELAVFFITASVAMTIIGAMGWFGRLAVWVYIPITLFSVALWGMTWIWVYGTPIESVERKVNLAYTGVVMILYTVVRWTILVVEVWSGDLVMITIGVAFDLMVACTGLLIWGLVSCVRELPSDFRICCRSCSEELASLEA